MLGSPFNRQKMERKKRKQREDSWSGILIPTNHPCIPRDGTWELLGNRSADIKKQEQDTVRFHSVVGLSVCVEGQQVMRTHYMVHGWFEIFSIYTIVP